MSGPRQKRAAAAARRGPTRRPARPSRPKPPPRIDSIRRGREPAFIPSLADAALNPDLDAKTRLDLVVRSLDRLDSRAITALAAIDRRAVLNSARQSAILVDAGLDPDRLAAPKPLANAGGPLIPVDIDPTAPAFEQATARVARDVSFAERLHALMPFVPLRKPLAGDAAVTSPFGYRADPFLGRPALHTGVDLLQPYGSDIRATAAGRVVHAGAAGGYGDMVEIDHGFGLSTVYGHMSEISVAEGQEVAQGQTPRPPGLERPLDRTASALRSPRRRRTGRPGTLFARGGGAFGRGIAPRLQPHGVRSVSMRRKRAETACPGGSGISRQARVTDQVDGTCVSVIP